MDNGYSPRSHIYAASEPFGRFLSTIDDLGGGGKIENELIFPAAMPLEIYFLLRKAF